MLKVCSEHEAKVIMQDDKDGIPVFRKTFTVKNNIKSAKIYCSALGIYDIFVNGKRAGNIDDKGSIVFDELKPGWTEYYKEVFYNTIDITHLIKDGKNGIGAQVGTGWWAGAINKGIYGKTTNAFLAKIVIEYKNGEKEIIVTDTDWKSSSCGPVIIGDIYDGETYDARKDYNWTLAEYDDSSWLNSEINNQCNGTIISSQGPAVRIRESLERGVISTKVYSGAISNETTYGSVNTIFITDGFNKLSLKRGETAVFDLGQNMVGWIKFIAKGKKGTKMNFKFGEMLNESGEKRRGDDGPAGSVYTYNLRTAKAKLNYIMSGDEEGEIFSPTTTFFGFRYCELTATNDIELISIKGEVVGSVIDEGSSRSEEHTSELQSHAEI